MSGRNADPGGAAASAATFSELASEPEAMPWAEIDPTKVLRRRRGRWCFGMARNCELRKLSQQTLAVHGVGGRGG